MTLTNLPIPPSVNESLTHARFHRRFIKTTKARQYETQMLAYSIKHKTEIAKLKQDLKAIIEQGKQLSIDYYFAFHEDRLIWKRKKTLRRLDVDNRIKAIQDQLSLILNIDDSYFISGHREKVIQQEDQPECVTVKIKQTNLRSLSAVNLDK